MNERGRGPATSRQLWRLNREGLLALRKEPGTPLANRQAAAAIAELVAREQSTVPSTDPSANIASPAL
jgi:hypothetical protein